MIEFRYSVVYDLIYHILAHMKVENPSNLYLESYIDNINKEKNDRYDNIEETAAHLSKYYNMNFDRLGIINFIPFYCSSVQELVEALENYNGFTQADKESFIFPLCKVIKSEYSFYDGYWNSLYHKTSEQREEYESWVEVEFKKYQALFSFFGRKAIVGLSYSITCNGRGFGSAQSFNAVVPFVIEKNKYQDTFYQILHEYTHQFTDEIVSNKIRMDDGTHDLSEKVVILFDYYLVKNLCPREVDLYLNWVGSTCNISNCDENTFLSTFEISEDINTRLLAMAEKIVIG